MDLRPLKKHLADWLEVDLAQVQLGLCLGVFGPDTHTKPIVWSDNPIGRFLYGVLEQLVALGALEKRDEPDLQYRWNVAFDVTRLSSGEVGGAESPIAQSAPATTAREVTMVRLDILTLDGNKPITTVERFEVDLSDPGALENLQAKANALKARSDVDALTWWEEVDGAPRRLPALRHLKYKSERFLRG